ncbi:hypothetical protein NE237_014121 [Protea cynaroides]|uniref:SHSP domain-containing protein n=1 Tax=Protea cynaroides TaxID=273540 RepID=A0A9Q0H2Z6_9MAGN|nr:hypothetical protein NE237_014121 [Protea cynaroides]
MDDKENTVEEIGVYILFRETKVRSLMHSGSEWNPVPHHSQIWNEIITSSTQETDQTDKVSTKRSWGGYGDRYIRRQFSAYTLYRIPLDKSQMPSFQLHQHSWILLATELTSFFPTGPSLRSTIGSHLWPGGQWVVLQLLLSAKELYLCIDMESLWEAAESLSSMEIQSSNVASYMTTTDDQRFLLLFIMGTYFGPDLKVGKPKKSALQRIAEGLPPYTSDQLSGSQMKIVEVERIYFYVCRKADQSVIVKLPLLHQFFQGNLVIPVGDTHTDNLQFPDLFPAHLHPQSRYKNRYRIFESIVFINNPEISYIKPDDVERFKRLTGLEDLLLDRDAARSLSGVRVGEHIDSNVVLQEYNERLSIRRSSRSSQKRQRVNGHPEPDDTLTHIHDVEPFNSIPFSIPLPSSSGAQLPNEGKAGPVESVGPAVIFLPSHPSTEEWNNIVSATKNGIALTGSAAERQAGPLIGLVDIGVCDDAYLFRISLPGVRKDEREFSVEVESDGQVLIKGITTTGERLVYKDSQVFEMQTQYLCPSGSFSVSFQLPGPVEPRDFSGNFGADGILEGIVMKER